MKNLLLTAALIAASTTASANEVVKNVKIFDHTKTITRYTPVTTYKCADIKKPVYGNVRKEGDAAGGALLGMIIGGVLGKGVTGDDGGAAAGAVMGGIIGADKGSKNRNSSEIIGYEYVEQCKEVVRNQQETVEVYSHSTIRFHSGGKRYVLDFQR
jgi:outer membrane lipoprotein SlyB